MPLFKDDPLSRQILRRTLEHWRATVLPGVGRYFVGGLIVGSVFGALRALRLRHEIGDARVMLEVVAYGIRAALVTAFVVVILKMAGNWLSRRGQ